MKPWTYYIEMDTMTPWEYLDNWSKADLPWAQRSGEWINRKMRERWPGNYSVVRVGPRYMNRRCEYTLEFKNPTEETMFKLKWS